jgi:NADH-quinone oxidoreductase subunit F
MGIHGMAAGGPDVLEAMQAAVARAGVPADVRITGGLGPDYAECVVSVIKPGKPRVFFKRVTPEAVDRLVRSYIIDDSVPQDLFYGATGNLAGTGLTDLWTLPEFKHQKRVVTANCGITDPTDLHHYVANGGYEGLRKALFEMTPEKVIDEMKKSNLRGRGGAAFPAGVKWSFLLGAPGPPKYLLCNGEEGDAGAFNDKHLLESDPHQTLEGLIIGGYACKASGGKGFVFIRTGWELPITRMQKAVDDAYAAGLLGKNILGSNFSYDVEVSLTGESYVAGEETALMEAVEGKRAMPRFKPPFPAAAGLWGKPSNINNVKTYSYAPAIVKQGGDWFSTIGTARSKGTALVCLSGHIARPGLYEVPFGLTLRQVIEEVGGGVPNGKKLKVLQTGGPLGGFLPATSLDMPIDFDGMVAAGAMFGSGGIIVGDETVDVVDLTRVLAVFNAHESCGKCFPCRIGTRHMADILGRMVAGRGSDRELRTALIMGDTMKSSLCAHGQLAENPIKSGVKYFEAEFKSRLKA